MPTFTSNADKLDFIREPKDGKLTAADSFWKTLEQEVEPKLKLVGADNNNILEFNSKSKKELQYFVSRISPSDIHPWDKSKKTVMRSSWWRQAVGKVSQNPFGFDKNPLLDAILELKDILRRKKAGADQVAKLVEEIKNQFNAIQQLKDEKTIMKYMRNYNTHITNGSSFGTHILKEIYNDQENPHDLPDLPPTPGLIRPDDFLLREISSSQSKEELRQCLGEMTKAAGQVIVLQISPNTSLHA